MSRDLITEEANFDQTIPGFVNALCYTLTRLVFVFFSFYYLGFKAFIFIFLTFWFYELFFYYVFDLERLSGNDKYFINEENAFQTTVGSVLELNDFNNEKFRQSIIERMFKKVRKLSAKVVHLYGDYFFSYSHISNLNEKEKLKIYEEQIIHFNIKKDKAYDFVKTELDKPFNPFYEQSFKVFLIKFLDEGETGGMIFFKINHLISDGLSFVNLVGFLDDKLEISKFPKMMRNKPSFFYGWYLFILEAISTITVGIIHMLNDKLPIPLLKKTEEIVGKNFELNKSNISNIHSVDFKKIYKFSKENKISINEICLGALSYGVSHFFPNNNMANLLIALGSKYLEEKIENLRIENKSDGVKVPFILTKDFESNIENFTKNIRSSLNHYYLRRIAKLFFYLMNELSSLRFWVEMKKVAPVDILCTNVPGQESSMFISGYEVINGYPLCSSTVNVMNVCFSTYAGKLNFSVAVKDHFKEIDSNKLADLIKEKFESLKVIKS